MDRKEIVTMLVKKCLGLCLWASQDVCDCVCFASMCLHPLIKERLINIVMGVDDDLRDDEPENGILLGAILIWPSLLLLDTTFPIVSLSPPPTTDKRAVGF